MLSPEDIEQKTFSTALRGYDLNEVDDFLDEIMATIRDLHEQLEAARSGQPASQPVTVSAGEIAAIDESAVGRALVAAQEAADRIVADANAEADRIREGAKEEAESWVTERQEARAEAEREMADLSARVDGVRRELALLATGVADSLDRMDSAIAEAQPAPEADQDGPRHAAIGDDEVAWSESDDGLVPEDSPDASDGSDGPDGTPDDEGTNDVSPDEDGDEVGDEDGDEGEVGDENGDEVGNSVEGLYVVEDEDSGDGTRF